ncbi:ectonucleotide pyrophosphatase/phosphodiesterase [Echinicola marina]|uniref:alkaline phosphatase family protein n=1 Tax=Echinicola marina TaxID=2859768 RepID=UPI001CF66778|nr:ectonucleotide pyrophosphatase/phosphodiesterase [Echinicola marina]UCS92630.1 ectonucleotide pyrophosphatase/phosphodiesterase [Echinicola marina]
MPLYRYFFILLFLGSIFQLQAQEKEQYVILVSLDGYRYDYTDRFQPENLSKFIKLGVSAQSLIPPFPSKTFPSHYSIATGMVPGKHGLVNNFFFDPIQRLEYRNSNPKSAQDGSWYGGKPLWVLAEENGMKAASYFFIGTEAEIMGYRPSYFYNYDGGVPNMERIAKVLDWLALPDPQRPRFISLYFSDLDDIGHRYGPENDEKIEEAVRRLDAELGVLFNAVRQTGLKVNILIVSDHGMVNIKKDNLLDVESVLEGLPLEYYNNGSVLHIYLDKEKDKTKIRRGVRKNLQHVKVVNPRSKKYYGDAGDNNSKLGDLMLIPDLGYYLIDKSGFVKYNQRSRMFDTDTFGEHGFHPKFKEMHGVFYANGPAIKNGIEINSFKNIHIYPLICEILNLPIPDYIDGDVSVLQGILE